MGRFTRTLTVTALACTLAGCGEPLIVLGDAPGLMRIVLGVGDSIGSRIDSVATRTKLNQPTGVVFDATTNLLYVADRGAVRQIGGISTPVVRLFTVTSRGRSFLVLDGGGCNLGPCMQEAAEMARAPDGALIIADPRAHRLFRLVPGGTLTVIAGTGVAGSTADGATAAGAALGQPNGVAVAPDGRIFFSEAQHNRVRVIGTNGVLSTVAGNGVRQRSGDGGPAIAAGIPEPAGLAFADNTLYIAEYGGASVRAVSATGTISTVAGLGAPGFSGDGGLATAARLDHPIAVALTADGRTLFISDRDNHRIRAVDRETGIIRTFAGTGARTYSGDRHAAGETSLSSPHGIDAASGFVFIADRGHSVIWRTSTTIN